MIAKTWYVIFYSFKKMNKLRGKDICIDDNLKFEVWNKNAIKMCAQLCLRLAQGHLHNPLQKWMYEGKTMYG